MAGPLLRGSSSAFREAIESGRPALIDIDLLALTPLSLTAPRPVGR